MMKRVNLTSRGSGIPFAVAICAGLAVCAVTGGSASAAESASTDNGAVVHRAKREATDKARREKLAKVEALHTEAKALESEHKFAEAESKYVEALQQLESLQGELELESSEFASEIQRSESRAAARADRRIREDYSSMLLKNAKIAVAEKRYEDAINHAAKARSILPLVQKEADNIVVYSRGMMKNAENAEKIAPESTHADLAASQEKNKQLLEKARVYCKANRFAEALACVEQVYMNDPFNVEAIELGGRIYRRYYTYGVERHKADVDGVVSFSDWQWAEPVFPVVVTDSGKRGDDGTVKSSDSEGVLARMEKIIFPRIEFDGADIKSALDYIERRSKENDPDKMGVNIGIGFLPQQVENLQVSLSFTNIPMSDLIRYVCQQTGLKYRIDKNAVFVSPEVDNMIRSSIPVSPNLLSFVEAENAQESGGGEAGGNEIEAEAADAGVANKGGAGGGTGEGAVSLEVAKGSSKASQVTEAQWKAYFTRRGVKFPAGSKIAYNKKKLIVYNTPENVKIIQDYLRQVATVDDKPLIMVEVKSVEVTEEDYQELGFDWALYNLGYNMDSDGTLGDKGSTGWLFGQGANATTGNMLSMLRSSINGSGNAVVNNLNLFPALFGSQTPFGSDIPLNVTLTINALARNSRTETLAAPKVITSDDTEATVSMEKTYYFPESWDEMEVEIETGDNTSTVTITPPVPTFPDEGEPIGIRFKVKPRVLSDRYTIRMSLDPQMSSFIKKDEWHIGVYGKRTALESVDIGGVPTTKYVTQDEDYLYTIWKPVIARRNLSMMVDVYNGETVVLGGMVQSNAASRVDKIPLLGDLPVIGRFFQSQSENSSRTNLLVFVTARLVNYDGMPNTSSNLKPNAIPDFNR